MAAATAANVADFSLKLNFFKLIVTDLERMTAFYKEAFGFEERSRMDLPTVEEVMLALPGDKFTIVLYRWKDGRTIDIGSGYGPVGFLTRNLEGAREHAIACGAEAVRGPLELGAARIAFLNDPEGHEIEMIQYMR